ncbi:MAG: hypothetical protein Q9218_003551 [Villophora microphyllina]
MPVQHTFWDDPVGVGVLPLVDEGKRGGNEEVMGSVTPAQRAVTFEPTQQESVAFGELAAQYPHSPWRFVEKPQLLGSFSSPLTHRVLSESLGKAQLVKSARIWSKKFGLGRPQS